MKKFTEFFKIDEYEKDVKVFEGGSCGSTACGAQYKKSMKKVKGKNVKLRECAMMTRKKLKKKIQEAQIYDFKVAQKARQEKWSKKSGIKLPAPRLPAKQYTKFSAIDNHVFGHYIHPAQHVELRQHVYTAPTPMTMSAGSEEGRKAAKEGAIKMAKAFNEMLAGHIPKL